MGKVLELIEGSDGKIRAVKLKQSNGAIEYHSICNLYPMELSVTHAIRDQEINENKNNVNKGAQAESSSLQESIQRNDTNKSVRPKRKATERFKRMLQENLDNL